MSDGRHSQPRAGAPGGRELLGLGVALAAAVLVPMGAGVGADALLHISPLGLLAGLILGITAAAFTVFHRFRRYL